MSNITRREFLEYSAKLAALMGLGTSGMPRIAEALEQLSAENPPVLWLHGQSCSGCSVSLLNSEEPNPAQLVIRHISLLFHSTLSAATGDVSMTVINQCIEKKGYVLVVEGSIPEGMPQACVMGHEPITELVRRTAKNAKIAIALGTCASFGGIPGAENNPTGAICVPDFLKKQGILLPVIRLPGCPANPDWIIGTLVHVLKFGIPSLDGKNRPKMFYSKLIHEQCPRFADYEREKYAEHFSDNGCLFKLGCLGPNTNADCTIRYWNSGTNSCIQSGAPCIGCASEVFARKASVPFYRKTEQYAFKHKP